MNITCRINRPFIHLWFNKLCKAYSTTKSNVCYVLVCFFPKLCSLICYLCQQKKTAFCSRTKGSQGNAIN